MVLVAGAATFTRARKVEAWKRKGTRATEAGKREEKTTVRIPISTQGEVKNFGVYAVPGLETHVFVGPFTSKNEEISDNDDIVCLDDDENSDSKVVNIMEPMVIIIWSFCLYHISVWWQLWKSEIFFKTYIFC